LLPVLVNLGVPAEAIGADTLEDRLGAVRKLTDRLERDGLFRHHRDP
jgi:hypothetical protein